MKHLTSFSLAALLLVAVCACAETFDPFPGGEESPLSEAVHFVPKVRYRVPEAAFGYQRTLTHIAQAEYGLDAPVARIAALADAESAWDPMAESRFAQGLTQTTPDTARWLGEIHEELRPVDPWDPEWSLRAAAFYTRWLDLRIQPWPVANPQFATAVPDCDHWAMVLVSYNGGLGNLNKDRRLAAARGTDPNRWWQAVERHSGRAHWAFKENRAYPRKVLLVREPAYLAAGWPGRLVC